MLLCYRYSPSVVLAFVACLNGMCFACYRWTFIVNLCSKKFTFPNIWTFASFARYRCSLVKSACRITSFTIVQFPNLVFMACVWIVTHWLSHCHPAKFMVAGCIVSHFVVLKTFGLMLIVKLITFIWLSKLFWTANALNVTSWITDHISITTVPVWDQLSGFANDHFALNECFHEYRRLCFELTSCLLHDILTARLDPPSLPGGVGLCV
jgi:hypothetical protein